MKAVTPRLTTRSEHKELIGGGGVVVFIGQKSGDPRKRKRKRSKHCAFYL
jgi:hypothetical protein